MKVIDYYPIFSLVGLLADIIGAFFLSIEAIGVSKIANWKIKFFDSPSRLLKARSPHDLEDMAYKENYLRFPTMLVGLLTGFGAFVGAASGLYLDKVFGDGKHSTLFLIGGIICSSIFVFFIPSFLAWLLKRLSSMFLWTEINFQKGQIGVLGFAFLLCGFVLQFIASSLNFYSNFRAK